MKIEYLQSLSDTELNELAAVKVMGWENKSNDTGHWLDQEGFRVYVWNPIGDMNDAMTLWNKLHSEGWEINMSCDKKITTPWDCRLFLTDRDYNVSKRIITHDKSPSRAITIASILAKE